MTRPLEVVRPVAVDVLVALRAALAGDGPAILAGAPTTPVAGEVPQRVALVVETSGSTAAPKRVMLSADALLASAAASASALGGQGQWMLALPVHYIAGLNVLLRSLASETDPVVLPPGPLDPAAFAAAAQRLDAELRFVSLVPAQLATLLAVDVARPALRRFDRILLGGQAAPPALIAKAGDAGLNVTRTYGSSETSGGCVYDGVPIGNTELRVTDGRVEIAGSVLAEGYHGDEARTLAAFIAEPGQRWYRTDDTGEIVDGVLRITGRSDDVIISGGVKVSLAEIERAVRELPGQEDAVVVPAPSERWGEVSVVVTTRAIDLDAVRAAAVRSVGVAAAAPDRIVVIERMPVLASGKPDRLTIRSLAQ